MVRAARRQGGAARPGWGGALGRAGRHRARRGREMSRARPYSSRRTRRGVPVMGPLGFESTIIAWRPDLSSGCAPPANAFLPCRLSPDTATLPGYCSRLRSLGRVTCATPTHAMAGEGNREKGGAMTSTITAALLGLMSGSAESALPRLELAPAARAVLAAFAASPTERLACLLGSVDGPTVRVKSVSETDDSGATATRVVARAPCPPGAVGRGHPHPGAERCWYWFPGTQVETSDAVSFRRGGYPVDAIVCGPTLVYVTRAGGAEAQSLALVGRNVPVLLVAAAVAFATAQDSTMRRPCGGQIVASDEREPDGSFLVRWARAIRSAALKPRISQSARLTLQYRRPLGAQLGITLHL